MQTPGKSNIGIADNGEAWIRGYRCTKCGNVADQNTLACRRCFTRDSMEEYRTGTDGKLVTWSIVHRSYPGIEVPFVSAVVELEDGMTLKANLIGCEAENLQRSMPVTLEFNDAGGAKDKDGNGYVAYHFTAKAA